MKGWKSSTAGRSPRPISKEMQFWYLSTPSLLVHLWTHNQVTSCNSDDWCICTWTSVKIIQGCTATLCVLCAHFHIKHTNMIWNVFLRYCCWRFAFCAVHLLTRGDLTDCHTWLVVRRATLCSTSVPAPQDPIRAQRISFKGKRKLTFTHLLYKGGSCQSHTITVCARGPLRWKITLPNQSLIQSLSSGRGQSNAHNMPSPWDNGQSVAHNACHCHVDADKT